MKAARIEAVRRICEAKGKYVSNNPRRNCHKLSCDRCISEACDNGGGEVCEGVEGDSVSQLDNF